MLALSSETKHEDDARKNRVCVLFQWSWAGWIGFLRERKSQLKLRVALTRKGKWSWFIHFSQANRKEAKKKTSRSCSVSKFSSALFPEILVSYFQIVSDRLHASDIIDTSWMWNDAHRRAAPFKPVAPFKDATDCFTEIYWTIYWCMHNRSAAMFLFFNAESCNEILSLCYHLSLF